MNLVYQRKPEKTELDLVLDYIFLRNPDGFKKVLSENGYAISQNEDELLRTANKLIATDPLGLDKLLMAHPDLDVILELVEQFEQSETTDNKLDKVFSELAQKLDKEPKQDAKKEPEEESLWEKNKVTIVMSSIIILLLLFVLGK